jgi:antitoxin component YwqK of YwqJK toxin-antitoxin module
MIFAFSGRIYDLDIKYGNAPIFTFINDNYKVIMEYYSIGEGGHRACIRSYKNELAHGTQYHWYDVQSGGHQSLICNYKNGLLHGTQYRWYYIYHGGQQSYIENWQNGRHHGVQHYWDTNKLYHTTTY